MELLKCIDTNMKDSLLIIIVATIFTLLLVKISHDFKHKDSCGVVMTKLITNIENGKYDEQIPRGRDAMISVPVECSDHQDLMQSKLDQIIDLYRVNRLEEDLRIMNKGN
jgi:hypothetical protein